MDEAPFGNSHSLHSKLHRLENWHSLSDRMTPVKLQRRCCEVTDVVVVFIVDKDVAHCHPGSLAMKVMVSAWRPMFIMQ